jgi:magnesium transporter
MQTEEAKDVRGLLGFETDSAGGMMTTDFVMVSPDAVVADAIAAIREADVPAEAVHAVHLVDPHGTLKGVVPLVWLVLSDAGVALHQLVADPAVSVPVHADTTEVVALFRKYGLLTLPVVDDRGRLAGIVTVDDVLDVARPSKKKGR